METAVASNRLTASDVAIRIARPDDGPTVQRLFEQSGKWEIVGLDWSGDPGPGWLIAEVEGQAVGCIQVLLGKPIARIELLCVPLDTPWRVKALAVKRLLTMAVLTCRTHGAQFAAGMLHGGLEDYEQVLQHRGAVKWYDGSAYIKAV